MQITNNRDASRKQTFTYDELNRVLTAETPTAWGNRFVYDIWGNLLEKQVLKGTSESFSAAATAQNQLVGYAYDASGNMQTGGYSYDAENRLTGAGGVSYTYDGEGQRVRKSSGLLYWYGAGGQMLTETDATGALIHEFVYLGGRRVGFINSAGNRYYYWSDHLGSANVVTNAQGAIKEESDFYPFGGERVITDLLDNRYKFTGKERDESGLDYFGARYYSSNMGRFLTADWSATPVAIPYADLGNPQSLNLYSYVEDNPITGVDPEGHFRFPSGHDQDPQYESPDSATATEQKKEAQREHAAEKSTTMPFPITPELPRLGLGKLVTTALGAAADLVTAPVVMVVATVGYLVSPGTGGMTEEKDTIQGHTPPSMSQQGTINTDPMAAEHTSGARPSTDGQHQEGRARARRDYGGEKGDKQGTYPRKPPNGWKEGKLGNRSGKWPPTNPRDQRIADGLLGR